MIKLKISYISIKNMLPVIVLIGCFIFFAFYYPYHLFYLEQMQLFVLTWSHFISYFSKPAAISCYLGDFFTQFYYLKGGGAIVITLTLTIIWWLLNKVLHQFGKHKFLFLLTLLSIILVALFHTDLKYPLASSVSLIFILLILFGYFKIKNRNFRFIFGIIILPLLYILFGSFFLLFILGSIAFEFKFSRSKIILPIVYSIISICILIIFPIILRSKYYLTIKQSFIYPNKENTKPIPDFEFEKILALDCELYFNHPEKVIYLGQKYKLNNKYASYFMNICSSINNQLPSNLLDTYQPGIGALYIPLTREQNYLTVSFSNEIYYLIGDVNAAQHCALLATTFSPKGQSSRMLRRLVEINIINGEFEVASKYIKMLENSRFHKRWANEMRTYLFNDELCNKTQWIVNKRNQIPIKDYIKDNPNDFETTLLYLLKDHPENKTALDYLLCFYLLNKNLDSFYKTIKNEFENNRTGILEPIYQEALLIYFAQHLDDKNKDLIPFSQDIFNRFLSYTDIYAANSGDGKSLQKSFGKTYWFYYHFAAFKNEKVK